MLEWLISFILDLLLKNFNDSCLAEVIDFSNFVCQKSHEKKYKHFLETTFTLSLFVSLQKNVFGSVFYLSILSVSKQLKIHVLWSFRLNVFAFFDNFFHIFQKFGTGYNPKAPLLPYLHVFIYISGLHRNRAGWCNNCALTNSNWMRREGWRVCQGVMTYSPARQLSSD